MLGHVLMRTSATPSQIHTGHVCPRSLVQKQGIFCTCRNNSMYQKVRLIWIINIEEWYEWTYFIVQTRFWMQLQKVPHLNEAFIVYGTRSNSWPPGTVILSNHWLILQKPYIETPVYMWWICTGVKIKVILIDQPPYLTKIPKSISQNPLKGLDVPCHFKTLFIS